MRLSDLDASVDLTIVGYESRIGAGDQRGLNDWLVVRATVVDGPRTHTYDGISLDVEDALEFARWLRTAAGDNVESAIETTARALLQFAEPDMAIQLVAQGESRLTTRWYFYDPAGPLMRVGDMALNARAIEVTAPRTDHRLFADAWARDVASL